MAIYKLIAPLLTAKELLADLEDPETKLPSEETKLEYFTKD